MNERLLNLPLGKLVAFSWLVMTTLQFAILRGNELSADDNEYKISPTHDYYFKYRPTHVVLSLQDQREA